MIGKMMPYQALTFEFTVIATFMSSFRCRSMRFFTLLIIALPFALTASPWGHGF